MKLKTIKEKIGNTEYTKLLEKEISIIKTKCCIKPTHTIYFLGHFKGLEMFLCDKQVYIAHASYEITKNRSIVISSLDLQELYRVKLYKKYPRTLKDIAFETIILRNPRYTFTPEEFFYWIDMPSQINTNIDFPYYTVIDFLNNYTQESFRTEHYLFYSKWDNDSNFITNIYAYDIKNKHEMKLYIPDKWENNTLVTPQAVNDIVVDDLSGKLSNYQKLKCKKEFLLLANQTNFDYSVQNYWLMELVKLSIQPIDELHEWSIHRVFCNSDFSQNIWVYDYPKANEEPYFLIINDSFTKVAEINFKSATYHTKNIFKRGNTKAKHWELDKEFIDKLVYFLSCPSVRTKNKYYSDSYGKYVSTNWQQLIFEYNHNTAGWGWGDTGFGIPPERDNNRLSDLEALPFDLQMPNYLNLLNSNNNEV